jgi:hypothetical protein
MNGSSKDIAKLHTVAQTLTDDEAIGLLPVFYANLDPSWIPSLDVLGNIMDPSTRLPCIENATKTLSSLCYLLRNPMFPLAATPDLWPRIWKWMEFLQLYHECIPVLTASQAVSTYVSQSQILVKFSQHPQTCLAMFSTKGVRRTLATAWAMLVHRLYTVDKPVMLGVIALPLLVLSDMKDPQNLVEVVDGCRGSYEALALTLMQNISQAVANSKSNMAVTAIAPVLLFLSDVSRISPDFVAYLLSHRIIPSLVSALDIDGVPPPAEGIPDQPVEVELCLCSLIQYLNVSPGYPWTVQAIQAGLLRRVITSSAKMATVLDAGKYPELLGTVLPWSLVFYPIITEMKKSFSQLETLSRSKEFSGSVLYGHWIVLKALLSTTAYWAELGSGPLAEYKVLDVES